jgi:hypothetical protein
MTPRSERQSTPSPRAPAASRVRTSVGLGPPTTAHAGAAMMIYSAQVRHLVGRVYTQAQSELRSRTPYIESLRRRGQWVIVEMVVDEPESIDVLGWSLGVPEARQIPFFKFLTIRHGPTEQHALNPPTTISAAPPGVIPRPLEMPREGRAWRSYPYASFSPVEQGAPWATGELRQPTGLAGLYRIAAVPEVVSSSDQNPALTSYVGSRMLYLDFSRGSLRFFTWNLPGTEMYSVHRVQFDTVSGQIRALLESPTTRYAIETTITFTGDNRQDSLREQFSAGVPPGFNDYGSLTWRKV